MPWVGLQCVIVVFPDHTHLVFMISDQDINFVRVVFLKSSDSSSQAKGTKSSTFLTRVRNEVDLVPMACEDASDFDQEMPQLETTDQTTSYQGRDTEQ